MSYKRSLRTSLFSGLFVLLSLTNSQAQEGWEAGFWIGASHYFGDLNTNYRIDRPGISGGVLARYNFNERLSAKISANYGSVSADDADSDNAFEKARNLNFESILVDGTVQFEFNFLPYVHGSKDEFFTPYLFAGLTAVYFNPQAELEGQTYDLRELGTEGQFKGEEYYTVQGGIAYGGGIKLDLSYEWSLNVEIGARYLFTDYLDDVSTVYPDMDDLLRLRGPEAVALSDRSLNSADVDLGKIGETGTQRGSSSSNDTYIMIGIGIAYYFGDLKCPEYGRRF